MEQTQSSQSSPQSPQDLPQQSKQPWRKPSVIYVPLSITALGAATFEDANGFAETPPG